MESNDALNVIASGLQALGFDVEQGKQKTGKLPHRVFFGARARQARCGGDEGTYLRTYEIDAFCHSSSRRQQVTPEPKPGSAGRCVHEIPVCSTNKIPLQRLAIRQTLPARIAKAPLLHRQQRSTNSHNSSETIHGATAIGTPLSLTTDADGVRRQRAGPFITKGALRQEPPTRPWRRGSSEAGRRFGSAGALCKGDLEVRWAGSVMEPSLRKLSSRRRTATQHLSEAGTPR